MRIGKSRSWILWYVSIGFGFMMLLLWLEDLIGLSYLVFGGAPHVSDWRDAAMESLLLVIVWALVFSVTKRLLEHLLYLEGFLRVCAWCRKVGYKDQWLTLENYFAQGFQVGTTHGVCPECFKKMEEDTAQFTREQVKDQSSVNNFR
jgi:hypothetical protein